MSDHRNPDKAVDYIIANSAKYAKAKAQRVYLEEFRKTKKALLMGESSAKTAAEREQYAYSHAEYQELLKGYAAAVEEEEGLKWTLEAARIRVDVWRTLEASNRGQERATR